MTIFIVIIGYLAGFFGVIAFIPQAIKTMKTKETKQISLKTYIIYNIANFLFLLLAILSIALPIMHPENAPLSQIVIWSITMILPYSVTMIGASCIIFTKVQNMRKFGEAANRIKDIKDITNQKQTEEIDTKEIQETEDIKETKESKEAKEREQIKNVI